ncbi:hypothetical protein N665_1724s0001 [Sinapis alba]|nr:hypothetical protein N665_1724s0001 [Sinapis alba]
MKNVFQSSLISFVMLTVLLFGVITTTTTGFIPKPPFCVELYNVKLTGKCDAPRCKDDCTNKRKGLGQCRKSISIENNKTITRVGCFCIYSKNKNKPCRP